MSAHVTLEHLEPPDRRCSSSAAPLQVAGREGVAEKRYNGSTPSLTVQLETPVTGVGR